MLSKKITITGIVQGVGFRPFVYKLAQQYNIFGKVYNDSAGVVIIVQCSQIYFDKFLLSLKNNTPKLAEITSITINNYSNNKKYKDFSISHSNQEKIPSIIILPDVSTCDKCINDITDKKNHRYGYAFTNCTNCGPRFSIIKALPYDRESTSMSIFIMCQYCNKEYQDPTNRRFHAQPNACQNCGPQLQLTNSVGKDIISNNIIKKTAALLKQGKIIAIKGIGGFHLACLASIESSVITLRKRKHRKDKPFALMAKNIFTIKQYCNVSIAEENLLKDKSSPIVLLTKSNSYLTEQIAPKQNNLGFMLPYSPLHYLLLEQLKEPLVMTSGNKSSNPQVINNKQALKELSYIADYFLMHNRDIVNRVDDSVVYFLAKKPRILRSARGYAPSYISFPQGFKDSYGVLATGAELKNTFCLFTNSGAVVSQHIGDLKTLASYQDFKSNINLYKNLYKTNIKLLACDMHPEYLSSKYATYYSKKHNIKLNKIQHHHAHIAASLFEHNKKINTNKVLGIVWDGMGLGGDNCLWGGEFLLADYLGFKRLAQFENIALLGGDKATKEPWRMTYSYFKKHNIDTKKHFIGKAVKELDALIKSNLALHYTSSVGRLFDAVAYLLGICHQSVSYEAQAAIELEGLASNYKHNYKELFYNFDYKVINNRYIISTNKMWMFILDDIKNMIKPAEIAYKFHYSLAKLIIKYVIKLQKKHYFDTVVLSGGAFNNKLLLELVYNLFADVKNITLLVSSKISLGDGGISLGQAAICAAREKRYEKQ